MTFSGSTQIVINTELVTRINCFIYKLVNQNLLGLMLPLTNRDFWDRYILMINISHVFNHPYH